LIHFYKSDMMRHTILLLAFVLVLDYAVGGYHVESMKRPVPKPTYIRKRYGDAAPPAAPASSNYRRRYGGAAPPAAPASSNYRRRYGGAAPPAAPASSNYRRRYGGAQPPAPAKSAYRKRWGALLPAAARKRYGAEPAAPAGSNYRRRYGSSWKLHPSWEETTEKTTTISTTTTTTTTTTTEEPCALTPWSEWSYVSENTDNCKKYYNRKQTCETIVSKRMCGRCKCGRRGCYEENEEKEEDLENCGMDTPVTPDSVVVSTTAPKWEGAGWKGHD